MKVFMPVLGGSCLDGADSRYLSNLSMLFDSTCARQLFIMRILSPAGDATGPKKPQGPLSAQARPAGVGAQGLRSQARPLLGWQCCLCQPDVQRRRCRGRSWGRRRSWMAEDLVRVVGKLWQPRRLESIWKRLWHQHESFRKQRLRLFLTAVEYSASCWKCGLFFIPLCTVIWL